MEKKNLLATGTAKWTYLILGSAIFLAQLLPAIVPSIVSIGSRHIKDPSHQADLQDGLDIALKVFGAIGTVAGSAGVLHERSKRGDTYTPKSLPGDDPPIN